MCLGVDLKRQLFDDRFSVFVFLFSPKRNQSQPPTADWLTQPPHPFSHEKKTTAAPSVRPTGTELGQQYYIAEALPVVSENTGQCPAPSASNILRCWLQTQGPSHVRSHGRTGDGCVPRALTCPAIGAAAGVPCAGCWAHLACRACSSRPEGGRGCCLPMPSRNHCLVLFGGLCPLPQSTKNRSVSTDAQSEVLQTSAATQAPRSSSDRPVLG